jgi:hypothetical protein
LFGADGTSSCASHWFFAAVERKTRETSKVFAANQGAAMPKENDLEGVQDEGGKHGGQKGMPRSDPKPAHRPEPDVVRNEKRNQPRDKPVAPGTSG